MTFILLIIVGIIAIEIGGLRGMISAYRQEVVDVKTYYNKVLRNNAEITVALFPQIIRELEEVGHISEADKCKKLLADAEKELGINNNVVSTTPKCKGFVPPSPKFRSVWL